MYTITNNSKFSYKTDNGQIGFIIINKIIVDAYSDGTVSVKVNFTDKDAFDIWNNTREWSIQDLRHGLEQMNAAPYETKRYTD